MRNFLHKETIIKLHKKRIKNEKKPYFFLSDFSGAFSGVPRVNFGKGKGLGKLTSSLILIAWILPLCKAALIICSIKSTGTFLSLSQPFLTDSTFFSSST